MTDKSPHLPSEFTAAVFQGTGQPLELRSFRRPELVSGEALVKVECCTLCGSDLHTVSGKRIEPSPSILGHEILGIVEQVSDDPPRDLQGVPLVTGDRITWSTCISCGSCDRCRVGLPQKCRKLSKYGHALAEGRCALSGGLSEAILLQANSAIARVPEELPAQVACPANCATATVVAAFRAAGQVVGKRVLVMGAGLLGLTATAFAKSRGASRTTVCDPLTERLDMARRFGADDILVSRGSMSQVIDQFAVLADQPAFDIVLDFSGSTDAIEVAFQVADVGARIVLVGSVMTSDDIRVNPEQMIRRCWQIHGIHNYTPADLLVAVEFLVDQYQTYPFAELVSQTFPLREINTAIRFASDHRPVRIAIRP